MPLLEFLRHPQPKLREEALVRWCALNQIAARPLNLVGYEDEAE